MANPNAPTFFQDNTAKAVREAETPAADFDDGMNYGGSNAPGIGIGTQEGGVQPPQWTLLDQDSDARVPQNSQHIGGSGLGDGVSGKATVPINTQAGNTVSLSDLTTGWVEDSAP